MTSVKRRIEKIEDSLNIGKQQMVVVIRTFGDRAGVDLPGATEQWLTYPEAEEKSSANNGVIVLHERKEIAARKKLQKTTKGDE